MLNITTSDLTYHLLMFDIEAGEKDKLLIERSSVQKDFLSGS